MTKTNRLRRPAMRYATGGLFDMDKEETQQYGQVAGTAGTMGAGLIDALAYRNDEGNISTGAMVGKEAMQGAAMGSSFGPIGTGVGAVLGAGMGLLQGSKLRRQERSDRLAMRHNTLMDENNYSAALIGANPEMVSGRRGAQMFAAGGDMKKGATANATATYHPDAYIPFGNKAQHAFDQGWMPTLSSSGSTTYRNRYGLLNKVVIPGDPRPGSVGIVSHGSLMDVTAMDADGKPFGEKMVSGGSYDDVDKYFSSNNNIIKERSDQILRRPEANATAMRYATGGQLQAPLASADMEGGSATPLSSDSVQINGNSHAQGGIQIPQVGAEVEGGETAKGSFVFSKELGFAKLHRPIAKAIGVIEQKPQTMERRIALDRLRKREEALAHTQEVYKQLNGIDQ